MTASRLHIIFSGSMGPCLGCQGRIRQFLIDQNAIVFNMRLGIPLVLEVNYTTPTQTPGKSTVSLPRQTQYGYSTDLAYVFANSGTGVKGYWSKVFTLELGARKPPVISVNPV